MNKIIVMTAGILLLAGIIAGALFAFGNVNAAESSNAVKLSCGCAKTSSESTNLDCPCGCNGSCEGNCGNPSCICGK